MGKRLRNKILTAPNALSFYRLCAAPVAFWLAVEGERDYFAILIVISLLTDVADGLIARFFDLATPIGARLDSLADELTLLAALAGVVVFEYEALRPDIIWFYLFLVAYALATAAPLIRFGKLPAFHLYSFRAAGYLLALNFLLIFTLGYQREIFIFTMIFASLANLEVALVAMALRRFRTDQRGLYWVMKDRMRPARPAEGVDLSGWVAVLNPNAGAMRNVARRRGLQAALSALDVEVFASLPEAMQGDGAPPAGIVICGGDGTIRRVIEDMGSDRRTLAILPGGRGNSVARDLGCADLDTALEALRRGHTSRIDLFEVLVRKADGAEERLIASNAVAFGALPRTVRRADRSPIPGRLGYVLAGLSGRSGAATYGVGIDGAEPAPRLASGVLVMNSRHLSSHVPCEDARIDDGVADVLTQPAGAMMEKLLELRLVLGLPADPAMVRRGAVVDIETPSPEALYIDGDLVDDVVGVRISVRPRALECVSAGAGA